MSELGTQISRLADMRNRIGQHLEETVRSEDKQKIGQVISDAFDILQYNIGKLKKANDECKHSPIFCENGRSKVDEEHYEYKCGDCNKIIGIEDVSRCEDECRSHNCSDFKEKFEQYDYLYASTSGDEASPIAKRPKSE
jgi:Zn finger protein HypA/HybF involved in hydrogenase expression